jgi:hypothetical protein
MKSVVQGRDFGKTIEVLDGMEPDDAVVVNPSDSIDDGMAVRIAEKPAEDDKKGGDQKGDAGKGDGEKTAGGKGDNDKGNAKP